MFRRILVGGAFAAAISAGHLAQALAVSSAVPAGFPAGGPVQLVHEGHAGGAEANGVINAVDPAHHTINLSHGSIKALGWPAMGMVVDSIRPASASNH